MVSTYLEGQECEIMLKKYLQQINSILRLNDLDNPCFNAAIMCYKKLCTQIKYLEVEKKQMLVFGSAKEKGTSNNYLQGLQAIIQLIVRNIDKWFSQVNEKGISPELKKSRKISIEFVLYSISSLMDQYPGSFKNLVSKRGNEDKDKLTLTLIKGVNNNLFDDNICKAVVSVLSKIFLIKDRRSESYCTQIQRIIHSISGFYSFLRPKNPEEDGITSSPEELYRDFVHYKFLGEDPIINLQRSARMMDLLFALLKTTLNQKKNMPYFKDGKIKITEILNNLEGILSQVKLQNRRGAIAHMGLDIPGFNSLLTQLKINSLQCLRLLAYSRRLYDHVAWVKNCLTKVLGQEEIMESHSLLNEVFSFFKDCIQSFGFGVQGPANSLLVNSNFIIHPDLMNHIMTMLKIVLLRKDTTIVKVNTYSSLKAGLRVDENMRDLSPEYEKLSTENIEDRLFMYLDFLNVCAKNGIIMKLKRNELAFLDSRLYTILQLSHYKFSPLQMSIRVKIMEILDSRMQNNSYSTHNKFLLDEIMKFLEMEEQEEVTPELRRSIDQIRLTVSVFSGSKLYLVLLSLEFEKIKSEEKEKLDANYSQLWAEANRKILVEILREPNSKKRDVKYNRKMSVSEQEKDKNGKDLCEEYSDVKKIFDAYDEAQANIDKKKEESIKQEELIDTTKSKSKEKEDSNKFSWDKNQGKVIL